MTFFTEYKPERSLDNDFDDAPTKSNWEEEFDKTFPQREIEGRINEDTWLGPAPQPKDIKSFITTLLESERQALVQKMKGISTEYAETLEEKAGMVKMKNTAIALVESNERV